MTSLRRAPPPRRPFRRLRFLDCLGGGRGLRQLLPSKARLERRDKIGRCRPSLDLEALDFLTRHLLFDRLQLSGWNSVPDNSLINRSASVRSWSRIFGVAPWSISVALYTSSAK